ncbi:MAG: hypothetical protein HRU20_03625 [Pseudomonadales bacterium]|nr:hypothetical protein [Pseudomonadales bacterium]
MPHRFQRRLIFHGAVVILLGMLSGIPLSMVLLGYIPGNPDDWKLAHMEGLINGLLLIGIAGCGQALVLSERQFKFLSLMLTLMAHGNVLYGWVRGIFGVKGLDLAPPFANQLAAVLGGMPVIFAFIAISLVIWGAYRKIDFDE